nr:hypothetical protein CFP56_45948 [Quercus suber]
MRQAVCYETSRNAPSPGKYVLFGSNIHEQLRISMQTFFTNFCSSRSGSDSYFSSTVSSFNLKADGLKEILGKW